MRGRTIMAGGLGVALGVAALFAVPALSAPQSAKRGLSLAGRSQIGGFTPAAADPRLAAALSRTGLSNGGFRFTPVAAIGRSRAVTVAVRSRAGVRSTVSTQTAALSPTTVGITPVAYDLGVGVGWKRFALAGDVRRIDTGPVPGGREGADLGVSYNARKWSTRVQVAADRPIGSAPRTIVGGDSVSLDVGGSYRLTRRLDVTAGVRYRSDRNRIERLEDERRDSQAVYVGTAFRF